MLFLEQEGEVVLGSDLQGGARVGAPPCPLRFGISPFNLGKETLGGTHLGGKTAKMGQN